MDITGKLLIFCNVLLFLAWVVWMWKNTPKRVKRVKIQKSYFGTIQDTKAKTESGYVWE